MILRIGRVFKMNEKYVRMDISVNAILRYLSWYSYLVSEGLNDEDDDHRAIQLVIVLEDNGDV